MTLWLVRLASVPFVLATSYLGVLIAEAYLRGYDGWGLMLSIPLCAAIGLVVGIVVAVLVHRWVQRKLVGSGPGA
jgi:uncharacterized membrane protein